MANTTTPCVHLTLDRVEIANTTTYRHFLQPLPTVNMASKKGQRTTVSLAEKTKVLDRVKAGRPRQRLIGEAGISLRNLERIVSKESEIREASATGNKKIGKANEKIK